MAPNLGLQYNQISVSGMKNRANFVTILASGGSPMPLASGYQLADGDVRIVFRLCGDDTPPVAISDAETG